MSLPRGLAPLRHRGFRRLAGGQLASNVGDAFYAVALPWYVLTRHGSPLLLGTVLAAYGVPRTALLLVGGRASDRWRPWTAMMAADVVRAVAVVALAVISGDGPASAATLVPIAAVLGAGEGFFLPGSFSIVPSLLPEGDLQPGNALTSGGTQLATLVGPALGGVCVAALGATSAFAIDAGTFVVSALSLAAVRQAQAPGALVREDRPGPAPADGPSIRHLLATEPVLVVILLVTLAANLGSGGMSEVALPALAHGPFRTGADGYGAMIAAYGGGALVGTLAAAQCRAPRRPAVVASIGFIAAAGCAAVVPYLGGPLPAAGGLLGFGVLSGFADVLTITAFQKWVPPGMMGRLMSLVLLASFGIFPVSVLLGGVVTRDLGPAAFFPMAAAMLAAAVGAGLLSRSWRAFGAEPVPAAAGGLRAH